MMCDAYFLRVRAVEVDWHFVRVPRQILLFIYMDFWSVNLHSAKSRRFISFRGEVVGDPSLYVFQVFSLTAQPALSQRNTLAWRFVHVFSDFAHTFGGAFDDPSGRLDAPCDRDCCCVAGLLRAWSWQSIAVAHLNISAWLQGLAVNARSRREQAWPWVWWWVINSFCFKLKKCFLSSAIRPLVLNLSRQSCSWYMQVAPTEPDLEAQACVGGRKALEH